MRRGQINKRKQKWLRRKKEAWEDNKKDENRKRAQRGTTKETLKGSLSLVVHYNPILVGESCRTPQLQFREGHAYNDKYGKHHQKPGLRR